MKLDRISIIGLGLIGGSLAKALHGKLNVRSITAVDSDTDALGLALQQGIIEKGITVPDESVFTSDIIFICTPVKQAVKYIIEIAPLVNDTCIVTDTCSTKEEIAKAVAGLPHKLCFIGGHPMAGTERSGYVNSYAHMFENAYYALAPEASARPEAVDALAELVKGIGAIPIIMTAEEHDRAAAGISHIPHVIAASLVNMVSELDKEDGRMKTLAAGGFRDITRIASSNPLMWENIVMSNKAQVLALTELFREQLNHFTKALVSEDSSTIRDFFADAGRYRDSISDNQAGLIQPLYKLIVDVQDRPGIIGEIATILGMNNINIKNINVANSREFEQGCLIVSLSDPDSVNFAFDLLLNTGYKVYKNK
ncbi:MAG TPA: prephenate dehydrogenase/arogenate dehydrogenase family protein [Clostridia bacterium]|nr:prephenate dehydrogenase/arogenate dehydrogenase family protein [Clostridia bacterium]